MSFTADLLVACFTFLLFTSIYRKRRTAAIRSWLAGWFWIFVHSVALAWQPVTSRQFAVQVGVSLGTLVLCGVSLILSGAPADLPVRLRRWAALLLGVPWMLVMFVGVAWPAAFSVLLAAALISVACAPVASFYLFTPRRPRFYGTVFLAAVILAWLIGTGHTRNALSVEQAVLTLCFGLVAMVLSVQKPRFSAANITLTIGAMAWSLVRMVSLVLSHWAPHAGVSNSLWNLPQYCVAAGMVLSLLDDEIRTKSLISEEHRLLFSGSPHPMWIYDPETLCFLDVNEAAIQLYGYSRATFLSMTLMDVMPGLVDEDARWSMRSAEPQTLTGPWLHTAQHGREFVVDMASHSVVRDGRRATFAIIHDVTEPQRLQARLIRQAHHDVLTGLPNRVLFEQRLEETIAASAADGSSAAVYCIDLDRFKQINDTFGHDAGDRCLRMMAERITTHLAGTGTLARTGGDEFMLVLGNVDGASAHAVADELLMALKPPLVLPSGALELVVSIGIAVYPEDGQHIVQLWRDADAAMYCAKRAGGAQWVRVSREISAATVEANELEVQLRQALRTGNLYAAYQPQLTLDGRLHSLEALVRFHDPRLAAASAKRVVALAEETGLIVPLGDWMLEEVCRQSREWLDGGWDAPPVALNVSPMQLKRPDFSVKVASTLERYQLGTEHLEFEVKESTVMPDRGGAPDQIATLAGMGIRFAVDDFGTGYSSLGQLHRLPVSSLKIDATFTRELADTNGTYPTVKAIIALAHSFGMDVVAEGVETSEQMKILQSLHCDRVEGYLFSPPLPAEQMREFMERRMQLEVA